MRKAFIECGRAVSTHGVIGEIKVEPWSDGPEFFEDLKTVYLDEGRTALTVERARAHKGMVLLKLKGVGDPDAARLYRGRVFYARREDIHLEEDEVLIADLLGMPVADADSGKVYGTLVEITNTGASDIYHIKTADGKLLLAPNIPDVVVRADPMQEEILIRPLEGLFDEI